MTRSITYGEWVRRFEEQTGIAGGAHFFCGPETLLRDAALARIEERLFGGGEAARLGRDRFYGGEGPLAQVTAALASIGLFSGARLVTLADAERSGRAGAAERRELIERLHGGLGGSVFVAFSELTPRELERKNELARGLLQACTVVEVAHPTPAEAMRWLVGESSRRGVPLDPGAAALLLARVGPSLQDLSRELEKLALWIEPGVKVDVARIEQMVQRGQLGSGWEFCESLLGGRTAAALRLLAAVHRTEPVLRTQWLLQRQARDRLSRSRGRSSPGPAGELLVRSFDLERGIKSGRIPSGKEGLAMEILVASSGPEPRSRTTPSSTRAVRG